MSIMSNQANHKKEHCKKAITFKQLIPYEIEMEQIIAQNPPVGFVYKFDFFIYLVNLTISIPMRNNDLLDSDGFVPFSSKLLQKKERNYDKHLKYLVQNGILDEYPGFVPNKKCRKYRISKKYLSNKLKAVEIKAKALIEEPEIDFRTARKYEYLYQWFNSNIQVDMQKAIVEILEEIKPKLRENYYETYINAYSSIMKLQNIQDEQFWFKTDDFGNRLHTNFTNLNGKIKKYISYGNEQLVSIDLKNSQPYISLYLVKKFYENLQTSNPFQTQQATPTLNNKPSLSIILVNQPKTNTSIDFQRFENLVCTGAFYKEFEREIRAKIGDDYFTREYIYDHDKGRPVKNTFTPKEIVKKDIFTVYFSKNKSKPKVKELFAELFPTVAFAFENMKQPKSWNDEDSHKNLAKRLQRMESHIMLDLVAKELARDYPDLPIFTIHDSIVTTAGHEYMVEEAMERIFTSQIGYKPTLTIEYWCKECQGHKMAA